MVLRPIGLVLEHESNEREALQLPLKEAMLTVVIEENALGGRHLALSVYDSESSASYCRAANRKQPSEGKTVYYYTVYRIPYTVYRTCGFRTPFATVASNSSALHN
jgi:hypothetical protein